MVSVPCANDDADVVEKEYWANGLVGELNAERELEGIELLAVDTELEPVHVSVCKE